MDFEYHNGTGPIDARSPFAQVSGNHQRPSADSMDIDDGFDLKRSILYHFRISRLKSDSKVDTRAAFASPTRSRASPTRPAQSQAAILSTTGRTTNTSPTKSLTGAAPFVLKPHSIFATPAGARTRAVDMMDAESTDGETPKSIDQSSILDSDATPDISVLNFRNVTPKFDVPEVPDFRSKRQQSASPTKTKFRQENGEDLGKSRRDSWWGRLMSSTSSPGRGEVPRGLHSEKSAKKVQKKRRGDTVRQLMRIRKDEIKDEDLDDTIASDTDDSRQTRAKSSKRWIATLRRDKDIYANISSAPTLNDHDTNNNPPTQRHSLYTFFEFLTQHPSLPQILSWYAQLLFNFCILSFFIYLIYSFYRTVISDVDKKSSEVVADLMVEMAICARQYTDNRCAPDTRVPAMEMVCNNWEKCMNRDTKALGRARISVSAWAEIFNALIEPISWKAMVSILFYDRYCYH